MLASDLLANAAAMGLLYDGVGIAVLGVPAMLSTTADLRQSSGTAWGYSPALIRSNVLLRLDTGTGSLLLVAGFLLQLFGSVGIQLHPVAGAMLLAALLLLVLAYWGGLRKWLADSWVSTIVTGIEEEIKAQRANRAST